MSKRSPFEEFYKYKLTDQKNHKCRHPKGIGGHHCPSWWGQYICDHCREYNMCECLNKVKTKEVLDG